MCTRTSCFTNLNSGPVFINLYGSGLRKIHLPLGCLQGGVRCLFSCFAGTILIRGHALALCLTIHPGVELRANLKSISQRCHLFEVAFVWELTKETIHLPLGCLQGGWSHQCGDAGIFPAPPLSDVYSNPSMST